MNERTIVNSPDPGAGRGWVDQYLPSTASEPASSAPQIDVAWLRGALFRQRWLILGVVLFALIAGVVVTLLTPPVYEAQATVLVNPAARAIVEGEDYSRPVVAGQEVGSYLATQLDIIRSRRLAMTVAQDLRLAERTSFLGTGVDESRPANRSDKDWAADKMNMAVERLQANVTASFPSAARVLQIGYRSEDPGLSAEIANAYTDAFLKTELAASVEKNAYAREYLSTQIQEVRQRLAEAERSANDYARSAGIVAQQTSPEGGDAAPTIVTSALQSISQTLVEARARRIGAEQKWRAVINIPVTELADVIGDNAMRNLAVERNKLNSDLASLRQRYSDEFPAIADVKTRLAAIDQQIARNGADVKASLRSEFLIARQQEQALEAERDRVTAEALAEQDNKIEYAALERESQALRGQLQSLLERFNQINTAANAETRTLSPLDPATVPAGPVEPSWPRNLLIAAVLGIGLAGGLALVREVVVDQFRRPEDLEDRLGIPVLGNTPFVTADNLASEENNQYSSLMEAYASIRATVDFAVSRNGAVIQMTSSGPSEGKSTTALILAQLFARLGRPTLLVDSDLRKPSVHALIDVKPKAGGLTEVILGHATFDEAKIEGIHENLTVLSAGGTPPKPIDLLSSQQFRQFLEQRRSEFSLVIIDAPPMLGLADSAELAKLVDATVFVVEANKTTVAQARTSLNRLRAVGARIMGGILTKYRPLEAGSDYGYQYQYYQYGSDKNPN